MTKFDWKKFYLSFKGRVGRNEFFLYFSLPYYVLLMLPFAFLDNSYDNVWLCLFLLLLWPYAALIVKRFHDFGRSAWVSLLAYHLVVIVVVWLVGFLSLVISMHYSPNALKFSQININNIEDVFFVPSIVLNVVGTLLYFLPAVIRGNKDKNKYGDPS